MLKMGSATHKVHGGKLIRVDITHDDAAINTIKITGDFFLHPEETLDEVIELLKGAVLPLQVEKLVQEITLLLEKQNAQLIGASPQDMIATLQEALL
jgi:lipoate-protein ligase A